MDHQEDDPVLDPTKEEFDRPGEPRLTTTQAMLTAMRDHPGLTPGEIERQVFGYTDDSAVG